MITHERWQRIKEIFHSAQERPPADRPDFLNEVCGDDLLIREEVEALLTADAGNENFLTSPAFEFAAGMLSDEAAEFAAGERVGRYEILCSLGAGGMGQIYLARDAQLGRNIALKLISQEFATDPRRVLRFEQEARAASALNHPNVCVIHEIGITDQGRHFIAMEYIQGATLRDHLANGPLKPLEALQITVQVGAALASAHAVGIVHRDIKPENIMLRPDGYVKVVDFGLAKLTEGMQEQRPPGEAQTIVRTEPRTLMGTVKYMSPEQLREVPVDERTDVWSLGVVLYEMLTGSTPFEARSRNDSVASILKSEPVQLTFPEELPSGYREIVEKALEKDCDERYQTTSKLISDLSSLKREIERNGENSSATVGPLKSSPLEFTPIVGKQHARSDSTIFARVKSQAILTADSLFSEIRTHKRVALFAGISSVVFFLIILLPNGTTPALTMNPVTNAGTSRSAAISPDGKWVAHAEEFKGKQQLRVTNVATKVSTLAVAPDDVKYVGVTFSPDSNYIYFTRTEGNGPGILYQLALTASNPTKLKTGVDSPITFSPQGERFAFVRQNTNAEYLLILSNTDGSNERVLGSRTGGDRLSTYGPAWSPDGSIVVCPAGRWESTTSYRMKLVAFDVLTGREQIIGQQTWITIFQIAWQDGNSLIVNAREHDASLYKLWRVRFPDGTAQTLTPDLENYSGVSIAGGDIVSVRTSLAWRIWVVNIDEPGKEIEITSGTGIKYGLTWTSQGKIVYSSLTLDRLHISSIDPDSANVVQLTNSGDNYFPAASPDGRYIVFSSTRNGSTNIWRMNSDGSEPTQLTFTDGNYYPSVSPDSQWVAYDNVAGPLVTLWKVSIDGGKPIKIGERYRMPAFSPDNQFIAGRYNHESSPEDGVLFPVQGGEPVRHFEIAHQEWQRIHWPSNREVSYIKDEGGYSNIWALHLDTGVKKQLTHSNNSDRIYAYAWSPDYKRVACMRGSNNSNVIMITEQ
ncbi:MAG TPA: protein kinase [Pyrinomonadaceae bacterium]|nr:protein kinase [Pyrinomonadaceae bacterium]